MIVVFAAGVGGCGADDASASSATSAPAGAGRTGARRPRVALARRLARFTRGYSPAPLPGR